MANSATTYDDSLIDATRVGEMIERRNLAKIEREQGRDLEERKSFSSMAEVDGGKRGLKGKAKEVVKKKIEKKVERFVEKKIVNMIPGVSFLFGAFVFFNNISTSDKKKKIEFDLLDWILFVASNIVNIAIILGVLAVIAIIADFVSADASWIDKTLKAVGGITQFGWLGMKAIFDLFH